jgi:CheY-like chemotaxis protein
LISLERTVDRKVRKPHFGIGMAPNHGDTHAESICILSISPFDEDHISLDALLNRPDGCTNAESEWIIRATSTLQEGLVKLRNNRISVVLSERDFLPGTWKDILAELLPMPDPPMLIVTSRLADEHLWAEALNLGAYDVLAKPFDQKEVIHVLSSAWLRKRNRNGLRTEQETTKVTAAAG